MELGGKTDATWATIDGTWAKHENGACLNAGTGSHMGG